MISFIHFNGLRHTFFPLLFNYQFSQTQVFIHASNLHWICNKVLLPLSLRAACVRAHVGDSFSWEQWMLLQKSL